MIPNVDDAAPSASFAAPRADDTQPTGCCSSTCTFKPAGSTCPSDMNPCTEDICNADGNCTHVQSTSCECGNGIVDPNEVSARRDHYHGRGTCAHAQVPSWRSRRMNTGMHGCACRSHQPTGHGLSTLQECDYGSSMTGDCPYGIRSCLTCLPITCQVGEGTTAYCGTPSSLRATYQWHR